MFVYQVSAWLVYCTFVIVYTYCEVCFNIYNACVTYVMTSCEKHSIANKIHAIHTRGITIIKPNKSFNFSEGSILVSQSDRSISAAQKDVYKRLDWGGLA